MIRLLSLAVAMAALLALPARAEIFLLPKDGKPAFSIDVPPGWTSTYDEFGNFREIAPDKSGAIQMSMLTDPEATKMSNADLAAALLKSIQSPPASRTEKTTLAGAPGDLYVSTMQIEATTLSVRVSIAKLDATHAALLATLAQPNITPAQSAALDAAVARVSFTGR